MRRLVCLAGAGVAVLIVASFCLDEGEVVTLLTMDGKGDQYETGLWIVDLDGVFYLRAESTDSSWLGRIRHVPKVTLVRSGRNTDYHAIPIEDEKIRETVNQAMAEKYGIFDQALAWIRDHSRSVPIQLEDISVRYASPRSDSRIGVSP